MEKIFTFKINKDSKKKNIINLDIDTECEKLYIDVNMPKEFQYMSYIVIIDEKDDIRLQKLLGYGDQKIAIGESPMVTTIGGVPGKISAGNWKIVLYIFTDYLKQHSGNGDFEVELKLNDKGNEITEVIGEKCWVNGSDGVNVCSEKYEDTKVYNTDKRWYKGDFHTHTTLSDGKETVENAMKKAKDMKLDFYVPTEHNLMHTGWRESNVMIIPGIEITTEEGHFNIFNIRKIPRLLSDMLKETVQYSMEESVLETIKEAKADNCIVSINHPFLTRWKWKYDTLLLDDINCIEIINDPTYTYAKDSNEMAIKFIDLLWEDGHKIYGVGGSDAHNLIDERYDGAMEPSIAGDPGTFIYCDKLTPKNLLIALKEGHALITRYCDVIPEIKVGNQEYLPGCKIEIVNEELITYKVEIQGLNEEPIVNAIINNKAVKMPVIQENNKYVAKIEFNFEADIYNWMRVDIRKSNGEFLSYINPIYSGEKDSKYNTFGEVVALMEEQVES